MKMSKTGGNSVFCTPICLVHLHGEFCIVMARAREAVCSYCCFWSFYFILFSKNGVCSELNQFYPKNSPERGPSEAVCEVWTRTNLQAALKELQVPAVDNK